MFDVIARQDGATTRSGEDSAIHAHKLSSLGQGGLMLSGNFAKLRTRADSMVLTGIASRSKPLRRGRKQFRTRWLLPLLFVAGYFATFTRFEAFMVEYAVLTGFAIFVCCLLLSRLNRSLQVTLPFWVIFLVFVLAYYVKFYWIALFPQLGIGSYSLFKVFFYSMDSLASAFATMTYAFGAFCLVAWILLSISRAIKTKKVTPKVASDPMASVSKYRFVSSVSLPITLFLAVVTTFIMYVTGIAVMGVESVEIPFRLAGLIFYTRIVLVPALFLLLIWCSEQAGLRKRTIIGLIFLFLYGLGDMLLRSSRSGLAGLLLPLVFLFLVSGRQVHKRHLVFFAGSFLLISFLYPIISAYRSLRIMESGDIVSSLDGSLNYVFEGGLSDLLAILGNGVQSILFRLTGVDMLIVYHGLGVQPLGGDAWSVLTDPRGVSGYVTVDIFSFSPYDFTAEAPSLVGWFYLVGGHALVVLGMVGFTLGAYFLWKILIQMRLQSLPVAQALFLSLVFTLALEGTLEGYIGLPILAWPASIAVCEWLVRFAEGRK